MIFNRPDTTRQVFERIRATRPKQLFVAADGPRADRSDETQLCAETRSIIERIDWPCKLNILFREHNLGCKQAVSSAITWFFENVEEGIILEDDCLPEPSFFPFCTELLERFRNNDQVLMVSGRNDLGTWKLNRYSYFFTIGNIWGWATWRRAWNKYDPELKIWTDSTAQNNMRLFGQRAPSLCKEIANGCEAVLQGKLDSWGYPWAFTRIAHRGIGVIPAMNLVSNIGFGKDATHTLSNDSPYVDIPLHRMQFPLRHNPDMRVDFNYYKQWHKVEQCHNAKPVPALSRVKNRLKSCYQRLWKLICRK